MPLLLLHTIYSLYYKARSLYYISHVCHPVARGLNVQGNAPGVSNKQTNKLRVLIKGIYIAKEGSLLDRVEKLLERIREKEISCFHSFFKCRYSNTLLHAAHDRLANRPRGPHNKLRIYRLTGPAGRHLFLMFHGGLPHAFISFRCLCLVSSQ